jgi:hypothetical protein
MKKAKVKRIIIAIILIAATNIIAMGAFTGTVEKKSSNLYSLKSFNRNFYRNSSIFSLRSGFDYKGTRFLSQKIQTNGDITITSIMRFEKGNTTYIYPYSHKIIVPKFKTPSPPAAMR